LNSKGQFSIIAALLVAVVLIAAVIVTYSSIRNSQMQGQPQLLSAVDETKLAIKGVLGYTVGYYASVLRVTANTSYADEKATDYLQSGFDSIASMHPEWGASFNLSYKYIHTYSFADTSYCIGNLTVGYDLTGLGIAGIEYKTECRLQVHVENKTSDNQVRLTVTRDQGEPLINLGKQNFKFYNYTYSNLTWSYINPSDIRAAFANGTYVIDAPTGIDPEFCVVQVDDPRGLTVTASSVNHYIYTLSWNSTFYSNLQNATIVIELLQNGTIRWLGQNLASQATPIPPVPNKSIHVNQTINNVNQEVPFQIEDWESQYRVPLGLTNNASLFSRNNMIVFLVNNNVSRITVWWDGSDTATQTSYAIYNPATSPFKDCSETRLSNGFINLSITGKPVFTITSSVPGGNVSSTATFLRVNNQSTGIGSNESYPILKGIVRDIVHQEGEWSGGIKECPNVYSQIIVTLPANTTYYTYQLRMMFMNSAQPRTLSNLNLVQLSSDWVSGATRSLTENGTSSGLPIVDETLAGQTCLFYNFSGSLTDWAHHWGEYTDGDTGAGIMFTDDSNFRLYDPFDTMSGQKTGALNVTVVQRTNWVTPTAVCDKCGEDSSSHPASNTIDGNTGTYWRHSSTDNHWIIFDMGKMANISKIRIYQGSTASQRWGQANGVEVYVSNDTSTWVSVWNGTLDASGWQESAAFSAQARYVKLCSRSTSSSQRLYEVNVQINEKQTTIEFNPVDRYPVSFTCPLDVAWNGAIVTFDGTMPICKEDSTGLWILTEYPPAVTVTAED